MFDNRRIISILVLLLFSAIVLSAQSQTDSATIKAPLHIDYFDENNFDHGNRTIRDSITYRLDSFQIVHPFLLSTGNLGAPGKYLTFQSPQAEPFSVRPDAFAYFGFNRYNRKFYSTNQPYTLLQYFVGQRREQYVDVIHTRNFGENLNFSFHFIRARSEGFYKRQNTSNTSVRSNLWYKSPGKRYALMTDIFWTGANVAENGGLVNDSSFEFSNQIDRQVVAVNLENAGTIQRKRGVWMKHTFALGDVTDTLRLDSAHVYNVITPKWGLSLVSELSDEKYNYNDGFPQSGFYDVVYRDTLLTADSTYCWRVNNSLRLEKFDQYGKKTLRGYLGARHEAGEYFTDTIYTHFQNLYAETTVKWASKRDTNATVVIQSWYVISGLNKGDMLLDVKFSGDVLKEKIHFDYGMSVSNITQAYMFLNYSGNNIRWRNSFNPSLTQRTFLSIRYSGSGWLRNVTLVEDLRTISNFVYLDSNNFPQQHEQVIKVASTLLRLHLKFGWFQTSTNCTWQYLNNDAIIRLPEWTVQHSMFANLNLFNRALQLQVGVDVTWFSEFTAEAYMPAVAQFYLQNQRTVGNYMYIDPWVSFRIKPVRVFVKAEHVNAGMMGRKYFLLDGYPHNDFALKIGISWLFSD